MRGLQNIGPEYPKEGPMSTGGTEGTLGGTRRTGTGPWRRSLHVNMLTLDSLNIIFLIFW
jgi:hypothetical protein